MKEYFKLTRYMLTTGVREEYMSQEITLLMQLCSLHKNKKICYVALKDYIKQYKSKTLIRKINTYKIPIKVCDLEKGDAYCWYEQNYDSKTTWDCWQDFLITNANLITELTYKDLEYYFKLIFNLKNQELELKIWEDVFWRIDEFFDTDKFYNPVYDAIVEGDILDKKILEEINFVSYEDFCKNFNDYYYCCEDCNGSYEEYRQSEYRYRGMTRDKSFSDIYFKKSSDS